MKNKFATLSSIAALSLLMGASALAETNPVKAVQCVNKFNGKLTIRAKRCSNKTEIKINDIRDLEALLGVSSGGDSTNPGIRALQGPKGDTGAQGPAGPQGIQGVQGPKGDTGLSGGEGATGPQGDTGNTGADGATGANGLDGRTLLNGTVDPTTEGAEGDFYYNTTTTTLFGPKTSSGWGTGVELVGPQGETGATGATGPAGQTGATGAQGVKGDTGTTGPQGERGATGSAGATGATGNQGATGNIGATGATGSQGAQGATGPQGPQGNVGAQGATGATGPRGATGSVGGKIIGSLTGCTNLSGEIFSVVINGHSSTAAVAPTARTFSLNNVPAGEDYTVVLKQYGNPIASVSEVDVSEGGTTTLNAITLTDCDN